MSMFLPDGVSQTQPQSGATDFTPSDAETTSADIALMQRVLSAASRNVNLIPSDFMAYIVDFIQTSRLQIPIGQVFGFSQFTAQAATNSGINGTVAAGSTASGPGPSLSGLSAGKYVVFAGADMSTQFANIGATLALTGPSLTVNGGSSSALTSVAKATIWTASAASNDITSTASVHNTSGQPQTYTIAGCWLIALKYANP